MKQFDRSVIFLFFIVMVLFIPNISKSFGFEDQDTNDEIRFSGYRGELINCEIFSYEVPISIYSKTNEIVVIKIIDPNGNVAGLDEFSSEKYERVRIIEMNWGNDGRYLIQVHYEGEIYQEDFTHNKHSPEIFQSYRMNCLEQEYIESVRNQTWEWFNFSTKPNNEGFEKNIQIADKLVRESDSKHLMLITSEKNIKQIISRETQIHDLEKISSIIPELKSLLQYKIEQKIITIFQESENRLIKNENITIDEKTELIFELRKVKDQQIINQKIHAEIYADSLYKIYKNAKAMQDTTELLNELNKERILQEKEKDLQIQKEKESIKQEILSKDKIIPEWIRNNAKSWSESNTDNSDFSEGIAYLVQNKIIDINELPKTDETENKIPQWVKNNVRWLVNDIISEQDFLNGMKYLIENKVIQIN